MKRIASSQIKIQRTAADMDLRTVTTMKIHRCHSVWHGAYPVSVCRVTGTYSVCQWCSAVYCGAQDLCVFCRRFWQWTQRPQEAYGCCPWSDDCLIFTMFYNDLILLGKSFCKGCSHPLTSLILSFWISVRRLYSRIQKMLLCQYIIHCNKAQTYPCFLLAPLLGL